MEPWLSWILAIGIGTGLVLYYRGSTKAKAQQANPNRRRQDSAESVIGNGSAVETASPKKRKTSKPPQPRAKVTSAPAAEVTAPRQTIVEAAEDDANDDKAWAQQLSAAQKGVNLNAAAKTESTPRAKNNKKKQRVEEVTDSAAWPSEPETSSKNVDDMLEPVAPGPSVMRLTGEEKAKKQVTKKPEPEKETKKQRQNRRKAEEKKAAREQDEQERKVLLENQRRQAREARGEPAKNGVPVAAAPTSSPWTKPNAAGKPSAAPQQTSEQPLLDTFDHEAASATSSNDPHTSATTPATSASTLGAYEQSEEAQLEMIAQLNENAGWNEVGKVKKGKKKASTPGSPPVEPGVKEIPTHSSAATEQLVAAPTPAPGLPTKAAKPANTYDLLNDETSFVPGDGPRHPQDSDWAAD